MSGVTFTVPLPRGTSPRSLAGGSRTRADLEELRRRLRNACLLARPGLTPAQGPVELTVKLYRPAAARDPRLLVDAVVESLSGLAYDAPGQVVALRYLSRTAQSGALYVHAGEVEP